MAAPSEHVEPTPAGGRPGGATIPPEPRAFDPQLSHMIAEAAVRLPPFEDPLFAGPFEDFAQVRVVLLGEASHGTSEFYRARAGLTRWLIERYGFNIVAAEADWPDAAVIDRHVRHKPRPPGVKNPFARFPTWMWRNREFEAFVEWMTDHNRLRLEGDRVGFYGLDLYNLSASIRAVIDYLDRVDPEAAAVARERYGCLLPWTHEPAAYGRLALTEGYARCEAEVIAMLREMLRGELKILLGEDDFLDAAMNAHLIQNAEAYYRAMYYGSAESWNLRDSHMFETLQAVLAFKGPESKAVVWAHNSHIGDARATEMGTDRGELNLGQLCREHLGADTALIGFGTHAGKVACASDWDGPLEIKPVLESRGDSYERLWHDAEVSRSMVDLRKGVNDDLRLRLTPPRLERFIGVIYRPETERWSHYVACSMPQQLDAYVWFDETRPVTPLPGPEERGATPEEETWPFGL